MEVYKRSILYVALYEIEKIDDDGVAKKIFNQILAFKRMGYIVNYVFIKENSCYLKYGDQVYFLFKQNKSPFKNVSEMFKRLRKMLRTREITGVSHIYIRKSSSNIEAIKFLRTTSKLNIINVVEIPVFPYRGEKLKKIKSAIGYYQDIMLNNIFYSRYVDVIVNYNGYTSIFGTKAIPINNGIDVDRIALNYNQFREDEINIGTASSMAYWHGYDRIIEGMKIYYSSEKDINIYLHLIGEGPEINRYKKMCSQYGLLDKVFFYGQLGGQELEAAFNKIDLGIGALAIYRKKLNEVSSIKTAEFLSRGIPIIYSGNEQGLTGKELYVLKVSNDDSPINMEHIIEFHKRNYEIQNIRMTMRDKAVSHFSWRKQYEEVFENFKKEANYYGK